MTVVLTRPTLESEALARGLVSHGIDSIIAPMLTIVTREQPELETELARAQAVLLTSANGARALAEATDRRDLSLFVVGDATATAARAVGFTEIESADGDAATLAALIGDQLTPDGGPLLHMSGDHIAGDIEAALSESGFEFQRRVLYDAVAAEALPQALATALSAGTVDGVLLFSPRSARTFVHLARQSDISSALSQVTAYCLSDAVAAVAERDLWRRTVVSARPRSESLIDRVVADLGSGATRQAPAEPAEADLRTAGETGGKAARPRVWPIVAASIAASALVAVIIVLALRAAPVGDEDPGVPADLEARLRSLDALSGNLADRLEALEARECGLADLAERVEAAETRLAAMAASADGAVGDTDLAALAGELEAARSELGQELDRVAQVMGADLSALSESVEGLAKRVEFAVARDAGAAGALLLAVGQLRAVAGGPDPFGSEVEAVRAVANGDPEVTRSLAAMAPWANQGVATLDKLQAGFQDLAAAILRAESLPEDAGWFETAFAEVKGLVKVRRVGEGVEGDDPQARLARAEVRLARGDLAGAVELIEAIDGAGSVAGPWLAAARGRQTVSAELNELSSLALIRAETATPSP